MNPECINKYHCHHQDCHPRHQHQQRDNNRNHNTAICKIDLAALTTTRLWPRSLNCGHTRTQGRTNAAQPISQAAVQLSSASLLCPRFPPFALVFQVIPSPSFTAPAPLASSLDAFINQAFSFAHSEKMRRKERRMSRKSVGWYGRGQKGFVMVLVEVKLIKKR